MKHFLIFLKAALLLLTLGSWPARAQYPSAKTFFSKPVVGSVALSPSGKTLAVTLPGPRGRMELALADLEQSPIKFKTVAWLPDYDIGRVAWVNEKRLVFQAFDSQAGAWAGTTGLWAVDADGESGQILIDPKYGGFRLLATKAKNVLSGEWTLASTLRDGSDDILIVERPPHNSRLKTFALARLNTRVPSPIRLTSDAPDGAFHWIADASGKPRWVESLSGLRRHIFRREQEQWKEVANFDATKPQGWAPRFLLQDQLFVATERAPSVGAQLTTWDAATGQPGTEPLLAAPGFDVGDSAIPLLDEPGLRPLGWRYTLDSVYTQWTDETMRTAQAGIDQAMPGYINVIDCRQCLSGKRWMGTSLSDRAAPIYSIFEPASRRITTLGSAYPDIDSKQMGARSFHRIKARDGVDMPVYLTLPAGPAAKDKPAVVLVHGGPWGRTRLEFNAVTQFLASRGYVVIEPEFRSSIGYGSAHYVAGWRQWGLTMQDDLQDALQWAVAKGWVDAKRACIMGASYGGYAALMGPVRHPDSYRCAISWVGVTDLPELLKNDKYNWGGHDEHLAFEELAIGDLKLNAEQLKQTSPAHRAADIHVPVLAAWGKDDLRVPLEQGRDFRDAAKRAGVDLEYVEYADEGHNWLKPETSIDFFTRAEKLLARTIGTK